MAYGIHRVAKAKAGDLFGLELEANRTDKDKHNFPKSNIDWERTKYNYYFEKTDDWETAIPRIIKEHGITKTIRKDAVLMIDGLYTASPEWFEGKTPEEIKEYFQECLDFHRAHYGVVFNAVVHMDEGTPHMAVASVPLVKNEDGSYSLSAKKLLGGRVDFHEKQDDFYNDVSKGYGLERGEIATPEARREHLDVLDYKLKMREEEAKAAEADKVDLESKCAALEKRIGTLEQIGGIIDFITDKIEAVFNRISDAINAGIDKLCSLIERLEPVREADLNQADCKMVRCGKITYKETGENDPLYCPKTNAGTPVTWNGVKPVALQDEDGVFLFGWKKDESGIAYCPPEEWGKDFNQDKRDELPEREDDDRDYIERGIGAIKYILDGEPETLEDLEEMEPPEEIDYNDIEIEPQEGKEENGEDSIDGFID